MIRDWPTKDPDDFLDYYIDWSDELLNGDSIESSIFLVQSPQEDDDSLVPSGDEIIGGVTQVWLNGGLPDLNYFITNRITTSEGRVLDQPVRLRVRQLAR